MQAEKTQPRIDHKKVKGWAVETDPRNDPTYPYHESSARMSWERPTLQPVSGEVLRSIEHNRLPAVFRATYPPRGLSGSMPRVASDWRHWLMLLGADRVHMVEGILDDLSRGHIPNVPAEMGILSEWQHYRQGLLRKAAITAAVMMVPVAFLKGRGATHTRRNRRAA